MAQVTLSVDGESHAVDVPDGGAERAATAEHEGLFASALANRFEPGP